MLEGTADVAVLGEGAPEVGAFPTEPLVCPAAER